MGVNVKEENNIKWYISPTGVLSKEYSGNATIFEVLDGTKEITVPMGTVAIEQRAFKQCTWLTAVRLPEGIREIGTSAFKECSALREVSLPRSLKKIGITAFDE